MNPYLLLRGDRLVGILPRSQSVSLSQHLIGYRWAISYKIILMYRLLLFRWNTCHLFPLPEKCFNAFCPADSAAGILIRQRVGIQWMTFFWELGLCMFSYSTKCPNSQPKETAFHQGGSAHKYNQWYSSMVSPLDEAVLPCVLDRQEGPGTVLRYKLFGKSTSSVTKMSNVISPLLHTLILYILVNWHEKHIAFFILHHPSVHTHTQTSKRNKLIHTLLDILLSILVD